jgi:hypothetical protein
MTKPPSGPPGINCIPVFLEKLHFANNLAQAPDFRLGEAELGRRVS